MPTVLEQCRVQGRSPSNASRSFLLWQGYSGYWGCLPPPFISPQVHTCLPLLSPLALTHLLSSSSAQPLFPAVTLKGLRSVALTPFFVSRISGNMKKALTPTPW